MTAPYPVKSQAKSNASGRHSPILTVKVGRSRGGMPEPEPDVQAWHSRGEATSGFGRDVGRIAAGSAVDDLVFDKEGGANGCTRRIAVA